MVADFLEFSWCFLVFSNMFCSLSAFVGRSFSHTEVITRAFELPGPQEVKVLPISGAIAMVSLVGSRYTSVDSLPMGFYMT